MKPVFSLQSFSFSFKQGQKPFFENINLEIPSQGLIFIKGKNGAGKSTFFRLLQGIVHASECIQGTLTLGAYQYDLSSPTSRQNLLHHSMILHQNFDTMLAPNFTGLQNLEFSTFDTYPNLETVSKDINLSELVSRFAIPLDKPVYQLSGGQRQMLALLMILQKDVKLLLLDEPTAALDSKNSDYVMQGIKQLARERNITVLCVSHDQELIAQYADSIIFIEQEQQNVRTFTLEQR